MSGVEGLSTWRYDGALEAEPGELVVRPSAGTAAQAMGFLGGSSRFEVHDAVANWHAEWRLDPGMAPLQSLVFELEPGLELLDAQGPSVASFRVARAAAENGPVPMRVTVLFVPGATGPAPVVLKGLAPLPGEGAWRVPGVRPLNARWVGGATVVSIDPSRVVEQVRATGAYAVEPAPRDAEAGPRGPAIELEFETRNAGSPCEIQLGSPRNRLSAVVLGQLLLGEGPPRLEAVLTWTIRSGRPFSLPIDLGASWAIDSVSLSGLTDEPDWQTEPGVGGGTRLVIPVPHALDSSRTLTATIGATYRNGAASGEGASIPLPRIVPVDAAVADERWVAWAEGSRSLRPESPTGLCWIDPTGVGLEAPARAESGLAWRWLEADGGGRISLVNRAPKPMARVIESMRVRGGSLLIDRRLELDLTGRPTRRVTIVPSQPIPPASWYVEGAETGAALVVVPRDSAEATGPGYVLDLGAPRSGRLVLVSRSELPWSGAGKLPLTRPGSQFRTMGVVLLGLSPSMSSRLAAPGILALDPAETLEALANELPPASQVAALLAERSTRWTHALAFDDPEVLPDVLLSTRRLEPVGAGAIVREAVLTSEKGPGPDQTIQLRLQILPAEGGELAVRLPRNSVLVRTLLDGVDERPRVDGSSIRVAIPAATSNRPTTQLRLDYRVAPARGGDGRTLRVVLPELSVPCLAMTWQTTAAAPAQVLEHAETLTVGQPSREENWFRRLLGSAGWGKPGGSPTLSGAEEAELLRRTPAIDRDGLALGELVARWDGGSRPLVVDRLAVLSGGWSPRTRIRLPLGNARAGTRLGVPLALRGLGLDLVSAGRTLVLTTTAARPSLHASEEVCRAWQRAAEAAIVDESDPSGRFLAAARWAVMEQPEPAGEADLGGLSRLERPVGATWLLGQGWTELWARFSTRTGIERLALVWAVGLVVFTLGLASRRWGVVPRLVLGALASGMAMVSVAIDPASPGELERGVLLGVLATLGFELGRAIRGPNARAGVASRREAGQAGVAEVAVSGAAILLGALIAARPAAAQDAPPVPQPAEPLIVVLPFREGVEPTQAWLRRVDLDRLRGSQPLRVDPDASRALARSVRHEIEKAQDGTARLTSRFELLNLGPADTSWSLPLGPALAVSATIDGRPAVLEMLSGGQQVRFWFKGAGAHTLEVARQYAMGEDTVPVPLNPVADAVLTSSAGGTIEISSPDAWLFQGVDDAAKRLVGPIDGVELNGSPGRAPRTARGALESLVVWDALPAGDRVRARLTLRSTESERGLRVRYGDDLELRSASGPGLVGSGVLRTETNEPIWVGQFQPPLPDGGTVDLEFWRSPSEGADGAGASGERNAPVVEPLDVRPTPLALVLRKPAGWNGRIPPDPARPSVPAPILPTSWKTDAAESSLEVAGSVLLGPGASFRSALGPARSRFSEQSLVDLEFQAGRVKIGIDKRLKASGESLHEAQVAIPANWQIVSVTGDSLTEWRREEDGRLEARFDGVAGNERLLRIEGWMALEGASDPASAASQELRLEWPSCVGASQEPSRLVLRTPETQPVSVQGSGLEVAAVVPASPAPVSGPRQEFNVTASPAAANSSVARDQAPALVLRWASAPLPSQVAVQSLLLLDPSSAELIALVRYRTSGGPLNAMVLSLPTEWGRVARIDLPGVEAQIDQEERGNETFWTIKPAEPLWGNQQVWVRAHRPIAADGHVLFPDLLPRGRGAVSTQLHLANATGRVLETEGAGVQPVDRKRSSTDGLLEPPPGVPVDSYTVVADRWRLGARIDPTVTAVRDDTLLTSILLHEAKCAIRPDGTVTGQSEFWLGTPVGAFLSVELPEGVEGLGASVDGVPARILREEGRVRAVALPAEGPRRVLLFWRATNAREATRLGLPRPLTTQSVPTTLVVRQEGGGPPKVLGMQVCGGGALLVDRVRAAAERIRSELPSFDRGSARQKANLLAGLLQLELLARAAGRSLELEGREAANSEVPSQQARLVELRDSVRAELEARGLEGYQDSARARLGEGPRDPHAELPDPLARTFSLGAGLLGRPSRFRSEGIAAGQGLLLEWPAGSASRADAHRDTGRTTTILPTAALAMLGAIAGLLLLRSVGRGASLLAYLSAGFGLLLVAPESGALVLGALLLGMIRRG